MVVELLVDYISGQIKIIRLDEILYVPGFSPLSFGEGWGEVTQAQQRFHLFIRPPIISE